MRTVVLLGNDDRYVDGVKAIVGRLFTDYCEINSMSFHAKGASWVFFAHPSPGNGYFSAWLGTGDSSHACKRILAWQALHRNNESATQVPLKERKTTTQSDEKEIRRRRTTRRDRYATTFHLIGTKNEVIYPIRIQTEGTDKPTFKLAKHGTGTHPNGHAILVDDEDKAYQMVASGTYKIRAIRDIDKAPSLLGLGDIAVREVVRK